MKLLHVLFISIRGSAVKRSAEACAKREEQFGVNGHGAGTCQSGHRSTPGRANVSPGLLRNMPSDARKRPCSASKSESPNCRSFRNGTRLNALCQGPAVKIQ